MSSQKKYIAHVVYNCHDDKVLKENSVNVEIIPGKKNIFFSNRSDDTNFIVVLGKQLTRLNFSDGDYSLNYEGTIENKPVVYGILIGPGNVVKMIIITRDEYYDIYVIVSTLNDL